MNFIKQIIILASILIFIMLYILHTKSPYLLSNTKSNNEYINANILYCNDGDTCRIKIQNQLEINVRLAGIDAPEINKIKKNNKIIKGQPFSKEATEFLNSLIKNKNVQIRQVALDPFNRPIVEIYLNNQLINLKILEQGYAEVYKKLPQNINKELYLQKESEAKYYKKGIWALENYISPKEFRKKFYSH